MFLDLEVIDSHLTLIICIIAIFAWLKALQRRAWEHARGGEEQLPKAGRETLLLLLCRLGKTVLQHAELRMLQLLLLFSSVRLKTEKRQPWSF